MQVLISTVFRIVLGVVFAWTGEAILFAVTLGRHKPIWRLYSREAELRFGGFPWTSIWLGLLFWCAVYVLARIAGYV